MRTVILYQLETQNPKWLWTPHSSHIVCTQFVVVVVTIDQTNLPRFVSFNYLHFKVNSQVTVLPIPIWWQHWHSCSSWVKQPTVYGIFKHARVLLCEQRQSNTMVMWHWAEFTFVVPGSLVSFSTGYYGRICWGLEPCQLKTQWRHLIKIKQQKKSGALTSEALAKVNTSN